MKGKIATARALLDSGATGNILNLDFVKRHRIQTQTPEYPLPLKTADGSESKVSTYATLVMQIQDSGGNTHEENIKFYIANIGKQDIILGTGWLIKHNPDIDWKTYQICMTRCPSECKNNHRQSIHSRRPRNNGNIQTCKMDVANKTEDHNVPDQWTATFLNIRRIRILRKEIMNAPEKATMYSNTAQRLAQEAAAKRENEIVRL